MPYPTIYDSWRARSSSVCVLRVPRAFGDTFISSALIAALKNLKKFYDNKPTKQNPNTHSTTTHYYPIYIDREKKLAHSIARSCVVLLLQSVSVSQCPNQIKIVESKTHKTPTHNSNIERKRQQPTYLLYIKT